MKLDQFQKNSKIDGVEFPKEMKIFYPTDKENSPTITAIKDAINNGDDLAFHQGKDAYNTALEKLVDENNTDEKLKYIHKANHVFLKEDKLQKQGDLIADNDVNFDQKTKLTDIVLNTDSISVEEFAGIMHSKSMGTKKPLKEIFKDKTDEEIKKISHNAENSLVRFEASQSYDKHGNPVTGHETAFYYVCYPELRGYEGNRPNCGFAAQDLLKFPKGKNTGTATFKDDESKVKYKNMLKSIISRTLYMANLKQECPLLLMPEIFLSILDEANKKIAREIYFDALKESLEEADISKIPMVFSALTSKDSAEVFSTKQNLFKDKKICFTQGIDIIDISRVLKAKGFNCAIPIMGDFTPANMLGTKEGKYDIQQDYVNPIGNYFANAVHVSSEERTCLLFPKMMDVFFKYFSGKVKGHEDLKELKGSGIQIHHEIIPNLTEKNFKPKYSLTKDIVKTEVLTKTDINVTNKKEDPPIQSETPDIPEIPELKPKKKYNLPEKAKEENGFFDVLKIALLGAENSKNFNVKVYNEYLDHKQVKELWEDFSKNKNQESVLMNDLFKELKETDINPKKIIDIFNKIDPELLKKPDIKQLKEQTELLSKQFDKSNNKIISALGKLTMLTTCVIIVVLLGAVISKYTNAKNYMPDILSNINKQNLISASSALLLSSTIAILTNSYKNNQKGKLNFRLRKLAEDLNLAAKNQIEK